MCLIYIILDISVYNSLSELAEGYVCKICGIPDSTIPRSTHSQRQNKERYFSFVDQQIESKCEICSRKTQACSDTTIISCFYLIILNYCSQLVITISALVHSELNYVLVHFSNILVIRRFIK